MTALHLSPRLLILAAAALMSAPIFAQPQLGHPAATAEAARRYQESLHGGPRAHPPACACTCADLPAKPVSQVTPVPAEPSLVAVLRMYAPDALDRDDWLHPWTGRSLARAAAR